MKPSQIVALGVLVFIIGGLAYSFFRQVPKLKPDNNPDNWISTGGSEGHTGGDGTSPSA